MITLFTLSYVIFVCYVLMTDLFNNVKKALCKSKSLLLYIYRERETVTFIGSRFSVASSYVCINDEIFVLQIVLLNY